MGESRDVVVNTVFDVPFILFLQLLDEGKSDKAFQVWTALIKYRLF